MDKLKFVRDGMSRLPPGFRFEPTEEELVFQYLKCKVFSSTLPASIIPEINVCKYDPWDLPGGGDREEETYLFSNNEAKYRNGNRTNRSTPSGYWKATGSDKKIVSSSSTGSSSTDHNLPPIVGMKKTLVFYTNKPGYSNSRTGWVMHEYRLVSTETHTHNHNHNHCYFNSATASATGGGQWVLCRIFWKKNRKDSKPLPDQCRFYDFHFTTTEMDGRRPSVSSTASSSSSSTTFTDITTSTTTPLQQTTPTPTPTSSNSDHFSAS